MYRYWKMDHLEKVGWWVNPTLHKLLLQSRTYQIRDKEKLPLMVF